MLTVLSLCCQPGRFLTPRPEFYSEQQGKAFVDDMTLWTTSYLITCILVIVAEATMKAQAWAGILFVCGQKLNVTKCYWYAISWRFKPTGEAVMETISNNPDLKITIITQQGNPPHEIK
jgi:hypothetical protein